MPFCPECEAEYESGIETCADCGVPLLTSLPPRDGEPPDTSEGEPVPLRNYSNAAEASMVANLLTENGVRAFVSGGDFTVAPSGFSGEIVLMVDERDLERARELYDAFFGAEAATGQADPDSTSAEAPDIPEQTGDEDAVV
jgi:hypothetical protein